MSLPSAENLLSWPVVIYLAVIILSQVALHYGRRHKADIIGSRRIRAGLDQKKLVDHAVKLHTIKTEAVTDALLLVATILIVPILIAASIDDAEQQKALGVIFLGLLIWVLVSATDIARAFLGGIAFRAFVGLKAPFQVGDRVTLGGHTGKVTEIGAFFVRLQTPDDDLVSIPTSSLWSAPLVSANAGDRASLCVMTFHLAPFVSAEQRKAAEDAIWDAIQKSIYWDFDKPMQIYVEQRKDEIVLTAKAYVALTYNEPLFKSDVYQIFLDVADAQPIPLASTEWRRIV